jgi:hypothetical protein
LKEGLPVSINFNNYEKKTYIIWSDVNAIEWYDFQVGLKGLYEDCNIITNNKCHSVNFNISRIWKEKP